MDDTLQYDDLQVHRWMLRDRQRLRAFEAAITAVVKPGHVVLDLGAGSGILSLLAARAGAARVYAVERTPVARLARQIAARNGFAQVIKVAEGDMQHVTLPEPVDVIVSEWLGTIGVDENLLYPVLLARDRWLKPGGTMLPRRVVARVAAAHLATVCEVDYLRTAPLGFDLSDLAESSVHDLLSRRYQVRSENLATPVQDLWHTDTAHASLQEALNHHHAELTLEVTRAGCINALVAWFNAELAPGVQLSNAPEAPETHWGQLCLPLDDEIEVVVGSQIELRLACVPRVPGLSDLWWSIRINSGPWQHHDTRTDDAVAKPASGITPPPFDLGEHTMPTPADAVPEQPTPPPAVALLAPADAAPLTCFLARLSVDVDMLYGLIRDPEALFEQEGLAAQDIAALTSRDAATIEAAMMKEATP